MGNHAANAIDILGREEMVVVGGAAVAGTPWLTSALLTPAAAIVGVVGIVVLTPMTIDAVEEAIESENKLDIIKQQSNEINKKLLRRALDKIEELKKRKNPHKEKGFGCKDPCLYLCFALRRVEEIKRLREFALKHPIPNDSFDHIGQLAQITQAVITLTEKVIDAKCKCDLIPHGF